MQNSLHLYVKPELGLCWVLCTYIYFNIDMGCNDSTRICYNLLNKWHEFKNYTIKHLHKV